MRDDVRRYFPGLCGVSEITVWQSRQVSTTNVPHVSLFTKVDDSAETAPYSVVSYGHVFAFSFHCHHQFERISPEANISLEGGFCKILFLSAVFIGFHSRCQSTFIPVPPSIRAM